ncbi:hypothetical protein CEXT_630701 [Caerostris extrusa]|uniref:Uncharacterized protein n=1 Tax=Caerostris extrusa TaxID=172846 RepID=A0AAV4XY54_CAEEX|nr:hypothetical protein CEXT_630701 [Caerostris extrusa]
MRSLCYCLFSKISAWYLEIRTFASIWYNKLWKMKIPNIQQKMKISPINEERLRKNYTLKMVQKLSAIHLLVVFYLIFFSLKSLLKNLKEEEIEEIEVELKLSDLYQFKQSKDLSTCTDRSIFEDMIYGHFLGMMKRITNMAFKRQSRYFMFLLYSYRSQKLLLIKQELQLVVGFMVLNETKCSVLLNPYYSVSIKYTCITILLILSNITDYTVSCLSEERIEMAEVTTSIRKWSPGSYTLLHDQSFFEFRLPKCGSMF